MILNTFNGFLYFISGTQYRLGNTGLVYVQSSWRPSVWIAVEPYLNELYVNVTLDSGNTSEILQVSPMEIYPDFPVQMGALKMNDTVLAPFVSPLAYSEGKVIGFQDYLTYEVQSGM